jgi:hypothetical protein
MTYVKSWLCPDLLQLTAKKRLVSPFVETVYPHYRKIRAPRVLAQKRKIGPLSIPARKEIWWLSRMALPVAA